MFDKILIANRGEIACRVIKTCKRLGIKTVAVYSEADEDGLHVEMADEHVAIGPAPAAESYLVIDKILEAAKQTGAQAIHPGFGFLSEKAEFVKAVEGAGLTFIGPGAHAIEAMGDKITSKKLAAEAGVSTVPGHMGLIEDADEAVKISKEIGFPVMIKASAGGGGKGMRIAHNEDEAREGFSSARNEAKSSFADDRVFIEKFVEEPRHIEIQVLADAHGNTIYLGERECSIQRRHQKVVEEAPSPFLDEETRRAMGEQAVALAKAVDYKSAGTVEFIVDKHRNFYFLEMNTRLQVEHPVTEMITGLDLVEQMIRVAAGEKLPLAQADVKLTGWAIETRVYAEDPFRNFLPSIGRLKRYQAPEETATVRIDTGVYEGAEISMFYDPMIAKLVTYGATRMAAIDEHCAALDRYYIRGIRHNIPFLAAVMDHPRFREGRLTTGFIAEEFPEGFYGVAPDTETLAAFRAVAGYVHALVVARQALISDRMMPAGPMIDHAWAVRVEGETEQVQVRIADGGADIQVGAHSMALVSRWRPGQPVFDGELGGRRWIIAVEALDLGYRLSRGGVECDIQVLDGRQAALIDLMPEKVEADTSKMLLCPMPGVLVSLAVGEGDAVEAGQTLAVVEAMKMENILRAERKGTVSAIKADPGDSLSVDQVILEFS